MNELWEAIRALIDRVQSLEDEVRELRAQLSYTGDE